ncbi:MAG: hypothetical protein GC171_06250 [Terrimonas sp.]|nr:hypothetical protein [Terrimonas sp.]
MKLIILHILIFTTSFNLFGQECDCLKSIAFLQQKIEDNQASYQHQVIEQKRFADYALFKTEINNKAKKIESRKNCIGLVALYLSFFRDEHSFISYDDNYTPQPNTIIKFKRNKNYESAPFEGKWYYQDGSFSVNVFPSKTTLGEWIAVINEDKSKSWKRGQQKIEFFKASNGTFNCIYWRTNLIPKSFNVTYTDSSLKIGRNLIFYRQKQNRQEQSNTENNFLFESLSEKTNYLKIPSFDLIFKYKIDSLITKNRTEIISKKNLIIDLRNNGGGGFDAFQSILPYVLDTNITESPYYGSVWVSKDNYGYYDETKYEYAETKEDSINELKYVEFLRENLGRFTPIENELDTIALEINSPMNIALLFNRNTASTAEGFILQAKSSKKIQTFGENTFGALSYGDWMPVKLPGLNIWVAVTTKKMIFKTNDNFESIGISPDIDLTSVNETEWLNIVLKQIEKPEKTNH